MVLDWTWVRSHWQKLPFLIPLLVLAGGAVAAAGKLLAHLLNRKAEADLKKAPPDAARTRLELKEAQEAQQQREWDARIADHASTIRSRVRTTKQIQANPNLPFWESEMRAWLESVRPGEGEILLSVLRHLEKDGHAKQVGLGVWRID